MLASFSIGRWRGCRWQPGRSRLRSTWAGVQGGKDVSVQFRILGPIEAVLDSGPAALGAPKQRGLLALLFVNRRRVVTSEQLIDGLWGQGPPAPAPQSLQVNLLGLRRALVAQRNDTAG